MKKATSVMYTIGNVLNIIEIVCYVLLIIVFAIGLGKIDEIFQALQEQGITDIPTAEALSVLMVTALVGIIFALIIRAIMVAVAGKAKKAINNDEKGAGIHVAVLVLSILCGGLFYFLGSIFGLVAVNQNK